MKTSSVVRAANLLTCYGEKDTVPDFKENVVRIEGVECLRETDKAILVDIEGDEYWIPQSQIDNDSEVYAQGNIGDLVISEWIADQKGLG